MTPLDKAIQNVIEKFPYEGYLTPNGELRGSFKHIPETVMEFAPTGGSILDFGCGPCDKTAVMAQLGYKCTGYDDLQDDWHQFDDNRQKILDFAASYDIEFVLANEGPLPFEENTYDMVMMHDVLEHLHDSPRALLNQLVSFAKPGGYIFMSVPNAVNIRKRLAVLRGETNLPPFDQYYWYPDPWRGHIREYVKSDLVRLNHNLGLELVEIKSVDGMLEKLNGATRAPYLFLTSIFRGWKDTWSWVARKPHNWEPKHSLPREELAKILGTYTKYTY